MNCAECKMVVLEPAEFHPYAACLLYKQIGDGDQVRAAMAYLAGSHPLTKQMLNAFIENPAPIDIILPCPGCGMLHVDKPEPEMCKCSHPRKQHDQFNGIADGCLVGIVRQRDFNEEFDVSKMCRCQKFKVAWDNPPHKSHLCRGCGIVWRPADVPTNGVAEIKTKGENDTWSVHVQSAG